MTDLTEQWKKGELPSGYYYVKNEFGNIFPTDYSEEYDSINDVAVKDFWTEVSDIVEVLAKVPTFEEWQRILHYASKYEHEYTSCAMDYENLKEENTKLKELLKECGHLMQIEKDFASCHFEKDKLCELLTKINQALGEDK